MSSSLVVEDGDLFRDIIKETLELEGHHVSGAASGEEAVRLCQELTFDLVITDIVMPEMNGLDLISFLRRFHPNLPILAFSGASETLLEEAMARGATRKLVKPFSSDELLAMVDKILGKAANPLEEQ
jgi:CheY-like chemotaxis protein